MFTNQQHFGVEEGLPQSYVSGIIQDEDGFIWIATMDGICRYDGRQFKIIRYRSNDSTSYASNSIHNIGPRVNNSLTLYYSPTQADDIDLRSFKISRNIIRDRLRKIPGAYWQTYQLSFQTANWIFLVDHYKGIGWLNSRTGKVNYANTLNGLLKQDSVNVMVQSPGGHIYLVSEDGVQVSDTSLQKFEWIPFKTNVQKHTPVVKGDVHDQRYTSAALSNNLLAIYDSSRIIMLDLVKRNSKIIQLPRPPANHEGSGYQGLQVDSKGRLYFASYNRIFRMAETGVLEMLWENTQSPTQRISAVFIDRSDVLWVSVNAQGVFKIDLQALPFQSFRYNTSFISDIMDHAGARRTSFPAHWHIKSNSYEFRYAYDSKGILYLTSNLFDFNEVYQYKSNRLQSLSHVPDNTTYTAIMVLPNDEIRVYDEKKSCWFSWATPDVIPKKIQLDPASMRGIVLADAKYIGGYTWMSTYSHGLLQYDEQKRINRFGGKQPKGFMPETLTEICPDPADPNRFWIGSRGGGLILWDIKKGLQKVFTRNDGLPNNTIYSILPDKDGNLWCSSNKGIFRFNPRNFQVTSFEKTDGLPGNEFNRAHKFIFPDGRLAFGGLDGYTIFNPAHFALKNEKSHVPILITSLQVNNRYQEMNNPGSFLKEPLSTVKAIKLPHNNNYLRFEFAAMQFNQPQKTRYRYQLKGADETWIENGTSNMASYAALRPGNYTFRVNATDNNGLWSDNVKEINVIISPAFWATWWAYLIYGLIIVALARWYFIFHEKSIQVEQNLAFEKREALRLREVDEMKDRFFSNVTHEFRTPLTLIINPLEKLLKDSSLPVNISAPIKTAQRNSKQLLRLINEFLDFSKLNNGQLKLKLAIGDPFQFTRDLVSTFEPLAREKNICLSFAVNGEEGYYKFDEEKWEKIVTNLLSNALKFTPPNGEVTVNLSVKETDKLLLEVKDSGPGIPIEHQLKIFNRFYQVDDSSIRNYGGTGIGLSLAKELVELMQGNIELESKEGWPAIFRVTIPVIPALNIIPVEKQNFSADNTPAATSDAHLVLVAEDNDELREFLVQHMRKNYRVLEAANGLQAQALIQEELPDIIISDVMMPGQDGFDLCNACKNDYRTAHIGFILLTSKATHEARIKGLEKGADDYITKPFQLDELDLRIKNQLQLQEKMRLHLQETLLQKEPGQQMPRVTDPFLLQLYKEMEEKLDDPELGVDYLCKAMAMSRSTLNRKLKSLLEISTNDLIRQFRLQKAITHLNAGEDISIAAYKVGFSSPSYFSQCFREQYGITPSEFIASGKNDPVNS